MRPATLLCRAGPEWLLLAGQVFRALVLGYVRGDRVARWEVRLVWDLLLKLDASWLVMKLRDDEGSEKSELLTSGQTCPSLRTSPRAR